MVIGFTIGSSLILPPGRDLQSKAWMAILLGLLEGLIFIAIFTTITQKMKKKSFLTILTEVFGNIFGKILYFLFTIYCFHVGSLVLRNFMDFISITMMPATPIFAIGLAVLVATAYAAYHGIGAIGRNSEILVPLTFIAVAITVLLLYKDMKIDYFKPFFEVKLKELLTASHSTATFPFGETVVFLYMLPYVIDPSKTRKSMSLGVIYGTSIILIAVVRNIAVLGIRASVATYPSAQAVRLINIANVITRLEVIIFFNLLTMGFIKACVLLWGSTMGFTQLLKIDNHRKLVVPVAIAMLFVATYQFQNVMENVLFAKVYPIYAPIFQVGIPVLTLIVAKIRKLI